MNVVERDSCFNLDTGGRIIGWFTLIGNIILALFALAGTIILSIYNCKDLEHLDGNKLLNCPVLRGVIIGGFAFVVIGCLTFAYFGWRCVRVRGMESRDPDEMMPLMVLVAMSTIFCSTSVLTLTLSGFFNGILNVAVSGYAFVVLHSLYITFTTEYGIWVKKHQQQAIEAV